MSLVIVIVIFGGYAVFHGRSSVFQGRSAVFHGRSSVFQGRSAVFWGHLQFFGVDLKFFAAGLLLTHKLCIFLLLDYFQSRNDVLVYSATMFTLHANEGSP